MNDKTEDFLGELRLGKQLSTTGHIAAKGLVVVLGLMFLVPGRMLGLVGPAATVATLLASVLLGLTLLSILELLGGSSERGGSYTLIHETLGRLGGFFAGWSIMAGYVALTAACLRATTSHLALLFTELKPVVPYLALGILFALLLIQLFRLLPGRDLIWPATLILIVVLVLVLLGVLIRVDMRLERAAPTIASSDLMRAVGLMVVSYAAIEAILSLRRHVWDPAGHLPIALLATLLVGGLLFVLIQLAASRFPEQIGHAESTDLVNALGAPGWLASTLAVVGLMLATNGCFTTGARQLNALSRQGALPERLRRIRPPFRAQPLLFGLLFIFTVPLVIWAPTTWLVDVSACLFLVPVLLLNLAAIYSRRSEPERRRLFIVPFYPLVPGVALAFGGALLFALPISGILGGGAWLLLGLVIYLTYGRVHLKEAQEGVLVFGREPGYEKPEGVWRILVPLSAGVERHLMLSLATSLARQTDGEVIALQVIPIADPLAIEEGQRIAQESNTLFQWSTRVVEGSGVPTFPITRLARSVSEGILGTADEEQCDLILLSWSIHSERQGVRMGRVLEPVVQRAPCDVAVVAFHPDQLNKMEVQPTAEEKLGGERRAGLRVERILVPTAGGPHAPLATRLALLLAREHEATISSVYVVDPDASQEELTEGQVRIQQTFATMGEQLVGLPGGDGPQAGLDAVSLESHVVAAESIVEGITQAGAESDLVFIGASEESLIDQVLFGNIPERVARACPSPVVMVKRFRGLRRFWLQRAWDALYGMLPTLSRQEQVAIYKQVRRGARPDVDFFIMIGLSAVIATYGLLQNSSAVIIGAMLVAPLFTPILALSLSIVRGDIRLLRLAVESALKGIALAIGLSILLTVLSPLRSVTHEITARTHPNLFDLAVALASGIAGAYAVARKDVASALPGVAIAAALVPPLGVIGIGLAVGDPRIAWGGSVLFITNLIAITLAGSVTLLLLGFRPTARAKREARLRLGLIVSLVLFTVITISLGVVFVRSAQESRIHQKIDQVLAHEFGATSDFEIAGFVFEVQEDQVDVSATVYTRRPVSTELAETTRDRLTEVLGYPVHLNLMSIPVVDLELPAP